ncbi:hypothetical protein R6Z07F_020275 [Ovis aries]
MPGMHELRQPERVFQDPREKEDLMEAQLFWGEEEEEEVEEVEVEEEEEVEEVEVEEEEEVEEVEEEEEVEEVEEVEVEEVEVEEVEVEEEVVGAEQSLQVVFGLEVDPSEHRYVLVPTLVLTLSEMLRDGQRLPKAGFLVVILCLIIMYEDCAPEEEVWAELCRMGLCPGRKHYICGEPRELLTHVWVREVYLEYQQVPDSDPAHYEFLWGPRAYVETSKFKGLNPETANEEENNAFLRLSFPRKLWMIVENAAFTSVHWNDEGDMVVIEADLFQMEVFQRSVAGQAKENHLPRELGGPSGEGMSSNSMSVSPATAGRDSAGQLPKSPPRYPDYVSVMNLYNTYDSIMKVAILVVAPSEAPEADEKEEECSDYTCALCEQFKDNPNP